MKPLERAPTLQIAEETHSRLILQPRPQLAALLVVAVFFFVGFNILGQSQRTTMAYQRNADGSGQCVYTQSGWLGTHRRVIPLSAVSGVDIRSDRKGRPTAYLETADGDLFIGTRFDGESVRRAMTSRGPAAVLTETDSRATGFMGMLLMAFALFVGYHYTITTTLCFDRGEGRLRVFYQGLLGKRVREVPLSDVKLIEVSRNRKALIQMSAHLHSGGDLPLVPPFVAIRDKEAIAQRIRTFLFQPVLHGAPHEPVPSVARVTEVSRPFSTTTFLVVFAGIIAAFGAMVAYIMSQR